MKKLYRSTLFAGVLAFGVVACGDDVSVVEPGDTPHPPLTVQLSGVSLNVGESANLAAQVSGGNPQASTSWTCESSNTSIVSVSQSSTGCLVTAEGMGNTTVTVAVTRGTMTGAASAQVTVAQLTQAQVSIHDIRKGGTTANINNIWGQLDVVINVEPGDETPVQLDLLVDEDVVASQQFSQAQIAELQVAADAAEASGAPVQITLSFNTGYYEIMDGEAWIRSYNGPRAISAHLHVAQLDAAPRASNTVTVTFNNTDGYHVSASLPENSAMDMQGRRWYGGWGSDEAANVTVYPVFYTGHDAQLVTVGMCGASQNENEAPFSFDFACAGFETNRGGGGAALPGEVPSVSAQYAGSGNNAPSSNILNADHPFPVRIDNAAPGLGNNYASGGQLFIATQSGLWNRENWINDYYNFTSGYNQPVDGGVSYSSYEITNQFVVTNNGDTILVESPADIEDETNTNTELVLHVVVADLLGNDRLITQMVNPAYVPMTDPRDEPMGASHALATFGLDRTAPAIAETEIDHDFGGGAMDVTLQFGTDYIVNTFNDDVVRYIAFDLTDQVSGFARPGAVSGNFDAALVHLAAQVRGTPGSATLNRTLIYGTGSVAATPFATSADGTFIAGADAAGNYVRTTTSIYYAADLGLGDPAGAETDFAGGLGLGEGAVGDANGPGYYFYQVRGQDKAGNRTPVQHIRAYANANAEPEISGINPGGFYSGGDVVTFPATSDDPVEILSGSYALGYVGIGWLLSDRNPTTIGELFTDEINRPADYGYTTDLGFIRSLSVVDADDRPTDDREKPTAVEGRVYSGYSWVDGSHWGDDFVHLNDDDQVSNHLFDMTGGLGFSSHFQANLLNAQVEDGEAFPFGAIATEGNQVIGPTDVDEDEVGGIGLGSRGWFAEDLAGPNRLRATVRGVSGQFTNPFAAVVVVARVQSADLVEYLIPASPILTAPSSQLDSGQNRDYYFDFLNTAIEDDFPGGTLCGYHVVGLSADYDGLATALARDTGGC